MTNYNNPLPGHRILNCVPSRDTEQDWQLRHAVEAGLVAEEVAAIPEQLGNRLGP
ncbi:hypothetical protein ACIRPU_34130 [Streptomyces sp. NPDC102259]|uniref:hypothetical protein n=1 Tax=Streptomyces sp. NPDC102259 TaxID=3366148 RepID=UPI00381790F6